MAFKGWTDFFLLGRTGLPLEASARNVLSRSLEAEAFMRRGWRPCPTAATGGRFGEPLLENEWLGSRRVKYWKYWKRNKPFWKWIFCLLPLKYFPVVIHSHHWSQSSRDQTASWMQVWPGLWEYLRLALPCVAMLAVEWWSFDPQINIYRMIQFQRSHVFLWHFGCSGTAGTYGRLFPFTRNLSAEPMGICGFSALESLPLPAPLTRWGDGVMGWWVRTNLLRMSLRPMSLRCCMCADLVRRRLHLHWLEAETETKRNHGRYIEGNLKWMSDAIENSRSYMKFELLATSNCKRCARCNWSQCPVWSEKIFLCCIAVELCDWRFDGPYGLYWHLGRFDWFDRPKCQMCDTYCAERTTSYCCCFRAKERWSAKDLDVIAVMTSGCWLADYLQTIWEIWIGLKPTSIQSELLLDAIRK